jgi:hypothetical protein|nr:hypothetical protein [Candidatus Krumholzibacteria bacterium]
MFYLTIHVLLAMTLGVADSAPAELIPSDLELAASAHAVTDLQDGVAEPPISLSQDQTDPGVHSYTIEGEDRISIGFSRPDIALDLDPRSAPGLGWVDSWDKVEVFPAVTGRTALTPLRHTGQPWLSELAQNDVVVFSPQAPDMNAWQLTIVDSRGIPAYVFEGKGAPPARLAWDGRRQDGEPAWPGLIYSHVMKTEDPAGNVRTFSGRGFELPPYRLPGSEEDLLVLAGDRVPDDLLLTEAASWLNQAPGLTAPIEIRATARSDDQARRLAGEVERALRDQVVGDPTRWETVVTVVPDAPDQGVVVIASRPAVAQR